MKRIFTYLIAIFSLFLLQGKLSAQSNLATVNISTTAPAGQTYENAKNITAANGFSTIAPPYDQIPLGTYNSGRQTRLIFPAYTFTSSTSTINFYLTLATPTGTSSPNSFSLDVNYGINFAGNYPGGGVAGAFPTINSTLTTYYFTITLSPSPLPANDNFRIELLIDIPVTSQDIVASQFAMGSEAVLLPVHFASITAKKANNGVQLNWQVGDENNVEKYEVERSINARDFTKVGEVAATHNNAYSFLDNQPISGVGFYRVRNVDIDGKYAYSSIVRVNLNKVIELKAYPQPATDQITIEHADAVNGLLTLAAANGQVVKTVQVKPGTNETTINIAALQTGLYILRFNDGLGVQQTLKVVKQ